MNTPQGKMKHYKKHVIVAVAAGILIIIVLSILYFPINQSSPNKLLTGCFANPGFYCLIDRQYPTGNVTLTLGQFTDSDWTSASFTYAPQSVVETNNVPNVMFENVVSVGLVSGQKIDETFPVYLSSTETGIYVSGSIWACYTTTLDAIITPNVGYCTAGVNSVQYVEIAGLAVRAT